MAAPTAQQCHTLITYYIKQFKAKHGIEPVVNRNTARWGFDSILRDYSVDQTKALVDYYLMTDKTITKHALPWLFNNYDRLIETMAENQRDAEARARLRAESQQRALEWRQRLANQAPTDD